ncbi:MAG: DNA mismatch repair endonuclease MutL [Dehalococcoidia bacterium]
MTIRILPPEVSALIAAGEVVERPASVVKELIENSLDAGANQISIEVRQGGLTLIRVTDNGRGIPSSDLALAFHRYATSKVVLPHDLARIATLGFRGEALPSVAAVADVEVLSRPASATAATYLRLVDGKPVEQGTRGAPVGTTVTVLHLFAKQPARRKFMRTPAAENQQIASLISHYALAYPEVRFTLRLDGRQALLTGGSGQLADAVACVYGAEVAAVMLPLERLLEDTPTAINVSGLAGPPHISRASRGYVSLFVNRRWVQNRRLIFAVEEAYSGLLASGRHPIAVVDLRLPYEEVDVNVHPTKAEVRFRDEREAFAAVQRAVRQALLEQAPVVSFPPSASVAPAQPAAPAATASPPLWQRALEAEGEPRTAAVAPSPRVSLPMLRVIGQVGNTYIVAEGPEGMYLIDQHAAHERVLFEEIGAARQGRALEVQGLLEPTVVELSPRQEEILITHYDALSEHGFQLEPFGERTHLLRAVPAVLAGKDLSRGFAEFLDTLAEETMPDQHDRVTMALACHAAIRAGQSLASEEMRELVRRLEQAEVPHTCPHGRPTMIHMSTALLQKEFRRR